MRADQDRGMFAKVAIRHIVAESNVELLIATHQQGHDFCRCRYIADGNECILCGIQILSINLGARGQWNIGFQPHLLCLLRGCCR